MKSIKFLCATMMCGALTTASHVPAQDRPKLPFSYKDLDYIVISYEDKTAGVIPNNSINPIGNGYYKGSIIIPKYVYLSHTDKYLKGTYKVIKIGMQSFHRCPQLTSVEIPNSVTIIGDDAFSSSRRLKSIKIPDSVTSIGFNPFSDCDSLVSIYVQQNNPKYASVDGVLYSKEIDKLKAYPGGKIGSFKIPDSVISIEDGAFSCAVNLTTVEIPNSVTTIGNRAFEVCTGLTSIEIPNSVTTIGGYAFWHCTGLTSIEIPNSVTTIGSCAFYDNNNFKNIYCHWEEPIKTESDIFTLDCLENTILYVPIGTKSNYNKISPWKNFRNIEEIDYNSMSGTNDILDSTKSKLEESDRFDISGNRVSEDYKGLVIIRYSDGSTRKSIVK